MNSAHFTPAQILHDITQWIGFYFDIIKRNENFLFFVTFFSTLLLHKPNLPVRTDFASSTSLFTLAMHHLEMFLFFFLLLLLTIISILLQAATIHGHGSIWGPGVVWLHHLTCPKSSTRFIFHWWTSSVWRMAIFTLTRLSLTWAKDKVCFATLFLFFDCSSFETISSRINVRPEQKQLRSKSSGCNDRTRHSPCESASHTFCYFDQYWWTYDVFFFAPHGMAVTADYTSKLPCVRQQSPDGRGKENPLFCFRIFRKLCRNK